MAKDIWTINVLTKREREKAMVSQMIYLYCKKITRLKTDLAPNVWSLKVMQDSAATNVRLWKQRHFARIVRFIAISRKCGKRSVR